MTYFILVTGCLVWCIGEVAASTIVKTQEHENVLLPCHLPDTEDVSRVRWWRGDWMIGESDANGEPKTQPTPPNISLLRNHTLLLTDVTAADSAQYVCQVIRDPPWGPINQQYTIQVLLPATMRVSPETRLIETTLGQEVTISCIPSGVPKPTVTWLFMGEEIKLLNNRNKLRFTATRPDMAGDYTCQADNGVGEPASATVTLDIIYPPEVTTEKIWVHTSPGVRTELSCTIRGSPQPKVDWLLNGGRVEWSSRVMRHRSGDVHSIILRTVRNTDLGYYTCSATNTLGQAQQVIHLSGLPNPVVFKKGMQEQTDDAYTLVWEVDSYSPIIEYKLLFRPWRGGDWSRVIVPADIYSGGLGPLQSQVYRLQGLSPGTHYEATVIARNSFGWGKPAAVLRFSTSGAPEMETSGTTENMTEINTITHMLPDFSTETEAQVMKAGSSSVASLSVILLLSAALSVFLS